MFVCPYVSLLTTTITTRALEWHRLKRCMATDVEPLFTRKKSVFEVSMVHQLLERLARKSSRSKSILKLPEADRKVMPTVIEKPLLEHLLLNLNASMGLFSSHQQVRAIVDDLYLLSSHQSYHRLHRVSRHLNLNAAMGLFF